MEVELFVEGLAEQVSAAWDTSPHVFRNALARPLFTAQEFMDGVLGTARDYVADQSNRSGRVFVSGAVVRPDQLPPFLPSGPTQSAEDYIAQLTHAHPDFTIILATCEKHIPAIRDRFVPFLHRLFSRIGYPARTNHGCVYSGTYRTSPFGIHTDPCHVLMGCAIGRKTMAFWPRAYFETKKELFIDEKLHAPVSDHLHAATVIEIGPHDVLYWPANTWHIAINETGEFSAAVSMGLYHRGSTVEMFLSRDFLPRLTTGQKLPDTEIYDLFDLRGYGPALKSEGTLSADQLKATQLSTFFGHWARVRDELTKPGEAEYHALEIVLTSLSSAGFGKPRAATTRRPPLEGALLRVDVPEALVAARARDGLLVGANGLVFFYGNHIDAIEAVIADLRCGHPRLYEDALGSDGRGRETIATLIQDLVTAGAVSVETSGAPAGPPESLEVAKAHG